MSYHISIHHVTPENTRCGMMVFESKEKQMASLDLNLNDFRFTVLFDSPEDLRLSLEKIMEELNRFVDAELSMAY